jgi:hypothetical protein
MSRPSNKNPKGSEPPKKKTVEVIALLKQAASIGCNNVEACIHAGISEKTYYLWMSEDEELSEDLKRLKNKPIMLARQTIVDSLDDVNNAKWYLERKLKNEFSLKIENDHKSSDGSMSPPKRIILEAASDNEED